VLQVTYKKKSSLSAKVKLLRAEIMYPTVYNSNNNNAHIIRKLLA
jgi:hypothetical protein